MPLFVSAQEVFDNKETADKDKSVTYQDLQENGGLKIKPREQLIAKGFRFQ